MGQNFLVGIPQKGLSVPGADQLAVEGSLVAIELLAAMIADNGAIVHIVSTAALGAIELLAVVLPQQRIACAAKLAETVGALAFVGDEDIVVAAGADDDAVAGSEYTALLVLTIGGKRNILCGTVVVAGGLQVAGTVLHVGLNLTEVPGIADDARQLARLRVELRVEEEVALVLAVDGVFAVAA